MIVARTWIVTLALALTVAPAVADVIVAGQVVKTDRREIYINLGEGAGLTSGARIRLKRPIALRHPVTRKPVNDWLPLGDGTVTDVGAQLTRIALPPDLLQVVKVGDIAEIYVERAEAVTPRPPTPTPTLDDRPLPTVDPETAQVLQVWRSTTAQPIEARIAAWSGWLAAHGDSPFAEAVRADLEVLRATQQAMTPDLPGRPRVVNLHVEHAMPTEAAGGAPVALAFVLAEPREVVAASLHVRTVGQPTFERVELTREHDIYLRGTLPAALVVAPGVEYFVEAVGADGNAAAAYASDASPATIAVPAPPPIDRFTATRRRTQLTIIGSYLDFATFDDRTDGTGATLDRSDRFAQTEIDVLYRLDGLVGGVRLGFGAYGGRGGFSDRSWTAANPAPVIGFQYGYVETELRLPTDRGVTVGVAGRFIAGVGREGFGVGAAGRIRLGDPDATNLSIGASGLQQVGFASDLRLETWPRELLPVGISVAVTDQPGNGDLGVRLATDVGYQVRPWVRPTVRVSWQGRTATHAGVGGGAGLVFDW
ncbi:MAG: hypothetical protein IPL61_06000 [Myxococcales bacterium]|nr:hypothetical protein [Myxococcales bacterium]